ncbi:MAG: 2-methylaconitate cis-trans isomerase PrpF [Candidatus Dormibacteraceae bacterium]
MSGADVTSRGQQLRLPAAFMRGGTSKGLFFAGGVLPDDPRERDRILSRAIGGGDPYRKQIDGLGGATSSTSKAVVVTRSERPGFDVDYLFAQVGIDTPHVDWQSSCGNLASAVGPFAIEEGLVAPAEGETMVRIWQVNTGKAIVAHVPTASGQPLIEGDFRIDGLPYPGAEIRLDFLDPGGGLCGRLLPTGAVADRLEVAGLGTIEATMVDAGNPCVMVAAADLGLTATALPDELNADPVALARLEAVRAAGAVAMGLAETVEQATRDRPSVPKIAFLAVPAPYRTTGGTMVAAAAVDVLVRMVSMGRVHHTLPGTGAVALAAGCALPGSVPSRLAGASERRGLIRLGHPAGVMTAEAEVVADVTPGSGGWFASRVTVGRTARRLMEGWVMVPRAGV